MGNCSAFVEEELEIINEKGLKTFLAEWDKEFPRLVGLKIHTIGTEDIITFKDWDGRKLITYWYSSTCYFLMCIAQYIEGWVKFVFEDDEQWAKIQFEKGKCIISHGQVKWSSEDVKKLIDDNIRLGLIEDKEINKFEKFVFTQKL
jgi:hypothetical protein